jgi:PTS system nitrogen regulatory IIA component
MDLPDFLACPVILERSVATREQAVEAILMSLANSGYLPVEAVRGLKESVLEREELGPTGIGEGVAIPHAWHPAVPRVVGALAVSRRGLDFESLDRKPVDLLALILAPPGAEGDRAKSAAFDAILRKLGDADVRRRLRQAATTAELSAILHQGNCP